MTTSRTQARLLLLAAAVYSLLFLFNPRIL